jgi:hypothetical protein
MVQGAKAMAAALSSRALFICCLSCRSAGNRAPTTKRLGREALYKFNKTQSPPLDWPK